MSKKREVDVMVAGAGFAGATCARVLAERGLTVVVVDRRSHIGGNAFDTYDHSGILIHPYGPHIFHTNSEKIIAFLSRFTKWRPYEHRVLASVDGNLVPIPINRSTLNTVYGLELSSDEQAAEFLEKVREPRQQLRTSEDVVLNSVGRDLSAKFFAGYTRKQWGLELSQLSASVAARIPTRTNTDDRYFSDTFQSMPLDGYARLFENLLDHDRISVVLGQTLDEIRPAYSWRHLVYTGPVDAYFDYRFGPLPYRSLRFEHEHLSHLAQYQQVGTINYPNSESFTRITEFKHLTGQQHSGTSIVREYPTAEGDPYYPVPRSENEALYKQYLYLVENEPNVTFVGRLATYRYYNMDQVVGAALSACERIALGAGCSTSATKAP
jgi:UDP-galactopyranose mutase